jgi:hypothetical protein
MSDSAQADQAIKALNGAELGGRALNVNEARPKTEGGRGFSRAPKAADVSGGSRAGRVRLTAAGYTRLVAAFWVIKIRAVWKPSKSAKKRCNVWSGEGERPPGGSSENRILKARSAMDHPMMPKRLHPISQPRNESTTDQRAT